MKIGILTFHASHNCGSMLQAFALQTVLQRELNVEVEIIDYSNRASREMYGKWDFRINRNFFKVNVMRWKHMHEYWRYRKDYIDFSDRYLVKSDKELRNPRELVKYATKYDVIISGGDQIWNVRCPDGGKEFYLKDIHGVRKIAYSPSLGGTNILKFADNLDEYRGFLNEFESLSVREPNGQRWLYELTGRDVKIVADPTILLSNKDWTTALPIPEIDGKYIFLYAYYLNNSHVNEIIRKISMKLQLPVIVMDTKSYDFYHLDRYNFVRHPMSGPLAFLGLMKNATLVLTQSFHGTVFASLFNRKFWSYNINEYMRSDDDRAIAILNQIGLPDRYILIDDLLHEDIMKSIDFDIVNDKIKKMREDALNYIKSFK